MTGWSIFTAVKLLYVVLYCGYLSFPTYQSRQDVNMKSRPAIYLNNRLINRLVDLIPLLCVRTVDGEVQYTAVDTWMGGTVCCCGYMDGRYSVPLWIHGWEVQYATVDTCQLSHALWKGSFWIVSIDIGTGNTHVRRGA